MKLTFKQVAEKAGVNQSTAAFQRDKFLQFFTFTGEGRHRKYAEESVEILSLISKMYAESKTYEDILETLEKRFGVQVTDIAVVAENTTTQLDIIEGIRDMLKDELSQRDDAIGRLENKVDELSQGSQERDRLLIENIRLLQENKKKWWHIFKK